jgi:hypothetical protein
MKGVKIEENKDLKFSYYTGTKIDKLKTSICDAPKTNKDYNKKFNSSFNSERLDNVKFVKYDKLKK